MAPASDVSVVAQFDGRTVRYGDVTSTFFRRGDAFMVATDGPAGAVGEFPIAYTFGVEPLQQYLIEFPDGRLQALSLCWDNRPAARGGQRWFHLYPDEAVDHDHLLHWTAPMQNWNHMCAECHTTALHKGYQPPTDTFATRWGEVGVACEACHGPASAHLAWAQGASGETDASAIVGFPERPSWVINPPSVTATPTATALATPAVTASAPAAAHVQVRPPSPELSVCGRCHSRRSQLVEGYRPTEPLLDTHRPELLVEGLYHADGQMRGEVYVYGSFLQSAMFRAGVTCSDCHDGHSLQLRASGNDLCGSCHMAARFDTPQHHRHQGGSAGAQCVNCHMPTVTYMGVDQRRDHSIRIPRPDLSVTIGTPNACNHCHQDRDPRWAASMVQQWHGSAPASDGGAMAEAGRAPPSGPSAAAAGRSAVNPDTAGSHLPPSDGGAMTNADRRRPAGPSVAAADPSTANMASAENGHGDMIDARGARSSDSGVPPTDSTATTADTANRHYGEVIAAGRARSPGASAQLVELAATTMLPAIVRATGVVLLADNPGPAVPAALARAAGDPEALVRMAAADAAGSLPPRQRVSVAGALLEDPRRAVRMAAMGALVDVPPRVFAGGPEAGYRRAREEYRQVQQLHGDRPESQINLGLLAVADGHPEQAAAAFRRAIELLPGFAPGYVNLADLRRRQGQELAAREVLLEGIAAAPESAAIHHALGLSLVRSGLYGEAIDSLRTAVELEPTNSRYGYVLGIALNHEGRVDEALRVLERSARHSPANRDLLVALTTVARDDGRSAEARRHAEALRQLAPDDPAVAQLLDALPP